MPLVMQKFYEYYEEIYSEKDQKFIEETGRGKIMYKISNFSDNDDVKIIDKSGPFEVIEYQRDLSVMPEDAQLAFFCSQMKCNDSVRCHAVDGRRCLCDNRDQRSRRFLIQDDPWKSYRRICDQTRIYRRWNSCFRTYI